MNTLLLVWLHRIVTFRGALRIPRDLTTRVQSSVVVVPIIVAAPLPNVSTHIVKSKRIGRILAGWGDAYKTVKSTIPAVDRKATLVNVGLVLVIDLDFAAPCVQFSSFAAASGEFPLGLGR